MPERSWFYASEGQQRGPVAETQLRDLIVRGIVGPDTLVWTEGMSDWQKVREIPGLAPDWPGQPPSQQGTRAAMSSDAYDGAPLSIDFDILELVWRSLVFALLSVLVIPFPWVFVWYSDWIVRSVSVPGRPNLSFTGRASTVAAWYFGLIVLMVCVALSGVQWLDNLLVLVQLAVHWLLIRWFIANIASNGQQLGLTFSGSFWAYLGWNILAALSIVTIIGWAWVYTAQLRWMCRNIQGTRREVVFKSTGLEFLWRTVVTMLVSILVIPAPWMYRWLARWLASQTVLVERRYA